MQSSHPPTHRLHFSPSRPAAPRRPATDHPNAVHELLCYISVPPEQFYDPSTSLASRRPEAELMRAILEDALVCFQRGLIRQGRRVQRLAREAEEWLFSDDTSWPFSFVSICAVLGLEPQYIRRGLAIQEKALGPGHPAMATSLNNLAALYCDQGRYAQTEPLYQRALAITEKARGPEHPDAAISQCLPRSWNVSRE
jgi:hypothetical protein